MSERKFPPVTLTLELEEINLLFKLVDNPGVVIPMKEATLTGRLYDKVKAAREQIAAAIAAPAGDAKA